MFYHLPLTKLRKLNMQYYFSNFFVSFICSFFIIKQIKSTFYLWKLKSLRGCPLHLHQLFGNCPPIIKRVSIFIPFTRNLFIDFHAIVFLELILRPYCRFASWLSALCMRFTGMQGHKFLAEVLLEMD